MISNKPVALLIVLGVVVGTVMVFRTSQVRGGDVSMKMAIPQKTDGSSFAAVDLKTYLKSVGHSKADADGEGATNKEFEIENDIYQAGSGLEWVDGSYPNNCPQVCNTHGMHAVDAGAKDPRPQYNSKYYVCAGRGNAPYHGLRPGFNLPNWNNGKCAFAWGQYVNKGVFKCLCYDNHLYHPQWVSNKKLIASCPHVCELEGKHTARAGLFANKAGYPRYDVCAVCHPAYGCRGGWNLDLVTWADFCTTPWGASHGKFTDFKCLCF